MGTIGIVLIIAVAIGLVYIAQSIWMWVRLRSNQNSEKPAPSGFGVSVNYNVSSIIKYGIRKLIALSVTIINRKDMELGNLQVVAMPGHRLMSYNDVIQMQQQTGNTLSRIKFRILNAIDFHVDPMKMRSGYLFFETSTDYCDIDKLIITMNNEIKEVPIRKGEVLDESVVKPLE